MDDAQDTPAVAIIGAGPAGLIAAEILSSQGHSVRLFDRMASPARKFLLAGRGGLNLTHSEPLTAFLTRYPALPEPLRAAIVGFTPGDLQSWCEGLGQEVFRGTSGRIFPKAFKAAPLLRAWLSRLTANGVTFERQHRWTGWTPDGALAFETPDGPRAVIPRATLLAMGGASWPRTGPDGAWVALLEARGLEVRPLTASNCGVFIEWPALFRTRFEGAPLKRIAIGCGGITVRGEATITATGLEGGAVYALSNPLRAALADGPAILTIDLRPDLDDQALATRLAAPRRARSLSNFLRQEAGLSPPAIGLVQAALHAGADKASLGALIKRHTLTVTGLQGLDRAISSAGGLSFGELDEHFMLRAMPGIFAAGEMLDWEAPTGGYLLQACFSTGTAASHGIAAWLDRRSQESAG